MADYITIDGGTTNTRISLVRDGMVKETLRLPLGARASIDGTGPLKAAVGEGIRCILEKGGVRVEKILASGMITSEFGLCPLDHILVPAGVRELHDSLHETLLEDVAPLPFVFARGVKVSGGALERADVMRGEETELMGLMEAADRNCVYILPGSHSKVVQIDSQGRIADFSTMLTGEMIGALSQNTILKDAVDLSVSVTDEDYLFKGLEYCRDRSLNEALFKVRILKNIFRCGREQTYSFFMGAVLWGEIQQILKGSAERIVIGGKSQIKNAMHKILERLSSAEVENIPEERAEHAASMGLIRIYEYSGRC